MFIIFPASGEPIKISAKLRNADYFGNWYGHKRFLAEFGAAAFKRMTKASTIWAIKMHTQNADLREKYFYSFTCLN